MRRVPTRPRGPRLHLSRSRLRGRGVAPEQLAEQMRPRRRRRCGLSTLALLVVVALAAWAVYSWWLRREEEHARLRAEVPEPWAPPADPAPEPPPPERAPEPVSDDQPLVVAGEQPPAVAAEPEAAPAFSATEPDEPHEAPSEPAVAIEPEIASEPIEAVPEPSPEAPEREPADEPAGIPSGARPLGTGAVAHRDRSPRPATRGPAPLPDGSFTPSVRRPAMPRSSWEPPVGR